MSDKMVRTQVYLPRDVYDKLQQRAVKDDVTLALQIRAALEDYLDRAASEDDDGILHADDPIFQMIGMYSSGVADASVNHDHYLYDAPKRADAKRPVKMAVREKSAERYRATSKKSSAGRRARR